MPPTPRAARSAATAGLLIALGILAATAGPAAAAPPRHRDCTASVPYTAGRTGYAAYRIPALVTTRAGTLLAFAEGRRRDAGDTGAIDVVLRRSTDGGCTWGPLLVVTPGDGDTRGNPTPVVDPATGDIVLLTCANSGAVSEAQIMRGETTAAQGRRVLVQTSHDDGRTFTAPHDITADTKAPGWRWYATGPGHAVALRHGPHAGRLVVPANHSTAPPAGSTDTGQEPRHHGAHALLSDDGGRTWRLGFVDDSHGGTENANESSVAELPDGRLYFNARDQNGSSPGNRLDTYSDDGGETLRRPYAVQHTLDDVPVVQGSLLQLSGGPAAPLLFAAPSVPTARRSMALWRSTTGGAAFTRALTLSTDPAAYCDLVQLGPSHVGILYETGAAGPYETIAFRRLPVPGPPR